MKITFPALVAVLAVALVAYLSGRAGAPDTESIAWEDSVQVALGDEREAFHMELAELREAADHAIEEVRRIGVERDSLRGEADSLRAARQRIVLPPVVPAACGAFYDALSLCERETGQLRASLEASDSQLAASARLAAIEGERADAATVRAGRLDSLLVARPKRGWRPPKVPVAIVGCLIGGWLDSGERLRGCGMAASGALIIVPTP